MHRFWEELKKCENDKYNGFDLKKMNHYDFLQHSDSERKLISYIFSDMEKFNLFLSQEYDEDLIISYEKLFLNILIREKIDYSVFFTELKSNNLINLRNAYFEALRIIYENSNLNILEGKIIKYLKTNRKHFCDDSDTILDILNSDLPFEFKKTYVSFCSTTIKNTDLIFINDEVVKEMYLETVLQNNINPEWNRYSVRTIY